MLGFGGQADGSTWDRRRIGPVYAAGGMIGSAHPLVTATGLDVLRRGGNAVDAAVAAGLTAAVVLPDMCGLGGDLFAIVHDPATNRTLSFLGSGISPRAATIEQMRAAGDAPGKMPFRGPHSVGVPGMVDAYVALLQHAGSRPFAELVEPAVGYAEVGHPITNDESDSIAEYADLLRRFEASAAVFLPDGQIPAPGTILKQPGLARTLRAIADGGPDVYYRGEIGRQIVAELQRQGGAMTIDDFAGHCTVVEPPLETAYRDYTVYQTGLPSQGLILLEALNIVEASGVPGGLDDASIHLLVEAKKLAYADRLGYARDPNFGDSGVARLISPEWAAKRAKAIDPDRAATDVHHAPLDEGDTTYLCVVDGNGMMVSLIQSVSAAFGSGIVAGETGVVLNNRVGRGFALEPGHPNVFEPGKRTMHTLNCFMIADRAGTMVVTGGTPGGDGQPQWNLQLISHLVDAGMDVQAAIDAPRWTSWPGTDPSTLPNPFELRIEERVDPAIITGLERRGHVVKRQGPWAGGGDAQIIARDPATRVLAGGTDPRGEGMVAGF